MAETEPLGATGWWRLGGRNVGQADEEVVETITEVKVKTSKDVVTPKTLPYDPVMKCSNCKNWFYTARGGQGPIMSLCRCWKKEKDAKVCPPEAPQTKS